jgi:hypothetical protein
MRGTYAVLFAWGHEPPEMGSRLRIGLTGLGALGEVMVAG